MASPNVDKITPTDSRVQHCTYTIPGSPHNKTYHYLLANPPSGTKPVATALLVHGFPDLSFGWRYQIPHLLALNLRVIVPDLPGFGRTTAPKELEAYSYKAVIDDLVAIVKHVQGEQHEGEKIVLGGHDWGGAVVWRFAQWYPSLLHCVFSVCTPFVPVSEVYYPKEQIAKMLPNFGYQVQLSGTEVDEAVVGRAKIRAFLSAMYGAKRDDGQLVFDVAKGLRPEMLEADRIGESPLLSREEMDYYVDEYVPNGMSGGLCWYKTGKVNFDEDRTLLEEGRTKVTVPALFVAASKDAALPPVMSAGMEQYCTDLVRKEVDATHWALWEAAAETNKYIGEFVEPLLKGQPLKASI